jgi:cyclin C
MKFLFEILYTFFQEISKAILALYDLWKSFDEKKEMVQIFAKMPKPKLQPMQPSQGHP